MQAHKRKKEPSPEGERGVSPKVEESQASQENPTETTAVANNETKLTEIVKELVAQVDKCEFPKVFSHQMEDYKALGLPYKDDPTCQAWVEVTGVTGILKWPCVILCQCHRDLGFRGVASWKGYSTHLIIASEETIIKSVWDLYDDNLHWDISGEMQCGPLPENIVTSSNGRDYAMTCDLF